MIKLKPCPFCGDVPHLDRHEIFCDCGAKLQIDEFRYQVMDNGLYPTYEEAKQMMVDAWNRRVKSDA